MQFTYNEIYFTLIFYFSLSFLIESCTDVPVNLDDHFIACCRGRPKYTSEPCIDALLANDTFSSVCLLNCMYREFEIYDGTEIDLAAVKTFLDGQIGDEDFHLMYMNAFERCNKFDKISLKENFSFIELKNDYGCDDYPQYMDICIWYHTLANCPEHYASNDENCIERRDWVNECLLKS